MSAGCPQITGLVALDTAVHTVVGGAAAKIISLHPLVGFVFGAAYFAGSHATNHIEQWMQHRNCSPFNDHTTLGKVMKFMLSFLSGIAIATMACTLIGAPVAFSTGINLTSAMLATTMIIATFVHNHAQAQRLILGPGLISAIQC